MQRRTLLKTGLAASTVAAAVGAGLLVPSVVLAEWNATAFKAKTQEDVLAAIGGTATDSGEIVVNAPDIAENGAVVPVKVTSKIAGTESIAILATGNNNPLTSIYTLGAGAEAYASMRIKMAKSADVIGIVKAGGKLYSAKKQVKVTIGGCGG